MRIPFQRRLKINLSVEGASLQKGGKRVHLRIFRARMEMARRCEGRRLKRAAVSTSPSFKTGS